LFWGGGGAQGRGSGRVVLAQAIYQLQLCAQARARASCTRAGAALCVVASPQRSRRANTSSFRLGIRHAGSHPARRARDGIAPASCVGIPPR
jgi:hypothetical protein